MGWSCRRAPGTKHVLAQEGPHHFRHLMIHTLGGVYGTHSRCTGSDVTGWERPLSFTRFQRSGRAVRLEMLRIQITMTKRKSSNRKGLRDCEGPQ
ncbi:hypothetical protein MTO96_044018 [Rhipicephalus appendiculatus]